MTPLDDWTPAGAGPTPASVTHIAGIEVEVEGRFLRQRCAWCGEVLLNYDYASISMPGEWKKPGHFEVGRLVRVHAGNPKHQEVLDEVTVPNDACALAEM